MDFVVAQGLTGLAHASALFLVASGLTIIFGVTRIVNFAHGSLYMLGAYGAYAITTTLVPLAGGVGFWAGVLASALAVGAVGAVLELLVMRRLYASHELFQLLATFGVVLIVDDVVLAVWGPQDLVVARPPLLDGAVAVMGRAIPAYDLVLIALGPVVLAALHWAFRRTRWGLLVRAATQDREMVGALGVHQRRLFTATVALGAALAGLGGALQVPREAASLDMDMAVIAEAFVVTVVGGMGSVPGAFLAALIVAELNAFGILVLPEISIVLLFVVMAAVLVVRPRGLLGRPELQTHPTHGESEPLLVPGGWGTAAAAALAVAVLAALPAVAGGYALSVVTELLIMALFAASLQFVLGVGGMISFGHAAYLGLGAYAAALLTQTTGAPMTGALVLAPLAGGLGALVFGWFCVRLSGVYMAMLTLAFAQIAWAAAHQWVAVTGGSNGILGVWPAAWASGVTAFYWLTLAVVTAALALLWRVVFSPFGYGVRATRDSPRRAEAVGIDLHRQRWLGFTLGGVFAGLAGGLYAFLKGSVFPSVLAIPMSIDALVMTLLGGVQTLVGPLLGAGLYDGLKTVLMSATDVWRAIVGTAIVLLCVAFPSGVVGNAKAWLARRKGVHA